MRTFRTISVFALAAMAATFFYCGGDGQVQPESAAMQAAVPAGSQDLAGLLPTDNAVPGWLREGEPRFFGPGNLWEYINGAADGYLLYGFEEVVTADFAQSGSGSQAVIDIYRMENPVYAFGIYAQERNPDSESVSVGKEGYLGGTALNFWAGDYYVKLTVFEESEDLQQEMRKLASEVVKKIKEPGTSPLQIGYFPEQNQIPRSVKFTPRDALGQSYFVNAFEAQYETDGDEYKMILIELQDPATAQDCLSRYQQFISASGEVSGPISDPGEGGFSGRDSFYGKMVSVRLGRRIAVVLGVPTEDFGRTVIGELLANIP